jgi:hypothetical protein
MMFSCLFINKRTNARTTKMWTEEEITKYLGSYVTDRAMKLKETNTTYVQGGDSYKVQIKYLK